MTSATTRIGAMNDPQVVRYFTAFSQHLFKGMTTSFDDVASGVPHQTRALENWHLVDDMTPEQAELSLPAAEASAVARDLLLKMAANDQLGPVLEDHLAGYRDDQLVVETILAVGLVATVLLVVSSTKFEYKDGKVSFGFEADPTNVKTILAPLNVIAKRLSGSK